jgi:transposase
MANVVSLPAERSEVEVSAKATRRRFKAEYKRRILREAEEAAARGELGALLRREGLYSSHLAHWREQARIGELAGLTPKKRGPQPQVADVRDKKIAELERSVEKLRKRAERAEALVEVQKKISQLLGVVLPRDEEKN